MKKPNTYNEIYEEYSNFTEDKTSFTPAEAVQRGKIHEQHLKGLIPEDKNIKILELGCGDGHLLYYLKTKKYHNITGVDISSQQIEIAKKMFDNVVKDDAIDYMANSTEKFDLIIALDIIEHINKERILAFLDSAYKSLAKNGRLILQTPNAESPWAGDYMYGDFTHEVFFTPSLLKKLLRRAGFENIEFRETGPVVHGLFSFVRKLIWKIYWCFLAIWNLAEKGNIGSGIYTRAFVISGIKVGD